MRQSMCDHSRDESNIVSPLNGTMYLAKLGSEEAVITLHMSGFRFNIHPIDTPSSLEASSPKGVPIMRFLNRKRHLLKDSYEVIPPVPFSRLDYVLCAIAFLLMGIASNPQIASLIAPVGKAH